MMILSQYHIFELDTINIYSVPCTIIVPVIYMARYVMVLRRARSLTRGIGRVGPGNRDFFGSWNGYEGSECHYINILNLESCPCRRTLCLSAMPVCIACQFRFFVLPSCRPSSLYIAPLCNLDAIYPVCQACKYFLCCLHLYTCAVFPICFRVPPLTLV